MSVMMPQNSVVYGPMQSRRFGISLGVNFSPPGSKWCNFHCPYCQYSDAFTGPADFLRIGVLQDEIREGFSAAKKKALKLDSITIAGNGEPTLHSDFESAVKAVIDARNDFFPGIKISILSNSSTCHSEAVRKALLKLDQRFMKLDAGAPGDMMCVNAPSDEKAWEKVIHGLNLLGDFDMQSMFVDGPICNIYPQAVINWIKQVQALKPHSVQIYTIQRAPQDGRVMPASAKRLEEIRKQLQKVTGITAEVFQD